MKPTYIVTGRVNISTKRLRKWYMGVIRQNYTINGVQFAFRYF